MLGSVNRDALLGANNRESKPGGSGGVKQQGLFVQACVRLCVHICVFICVHVDLCMYL